MNQDQHLFQILKTRLEENMYFYLSFFLYKRLSFELIRKCNLIERFELVLLNDLNYANYDIEQLK